QTCLCYALTLNGSVVALNVFSNGACQLFFNYLSYKGIQINLNSTLYLLQPLPTDQCCKNISWVLNKIENSLTSSVDVAGPLNLYIDDQDNLVTAEYYGRLIKLNRYNLTVLNRITLLDGVGAISYNEGYYYIGSGIPGTTTAYLSIYDSHTMALIVNITGPTSYFGPIRECRFINNNSIMIALSQAQYSYSLLLFYQINSPTNYTLIRQLMAPTWAVYCLYKVNDTFFYLTMFYTNSLIYTVQYNSFTQNWTITQFVTLTVQPTTPASVLIDPCNRIWVADYYGGIRIYDQQGQYLTTWNTIVQTPLYMLMLDNYELYIADDGNNRILRFVPNIQCIV
ncbi:unnamed protein product, partial [Didymodactylos carnosus]